MATATSPRLLPIQLAVIATVSCGLIALHSVSPALAQCPIVERDHLFASDGSAGDTFGSSVAIDGNTLVIGSHNDDTALADLVGSAYVFELVGGAWVETAHLFAPDGAYLHNFGFAVAISGDTIVVGAQNNGPGSVYVFVRDDGVWSFQAQLWASDGATRDDFGAAVAVSGDTILVGAREDDIGLQEDVGSAYVFVRDNGQWTEQARIFAPGAPEYGEFARAVALSGDTAVLGRAGNSTLVFERSNGVWSQDAVLLAPGGANGDGFGDSVDIQGDTIVVGADRDATPGGTGAGSAHVFVRSGGVWTWQAQLLASDGAANDFFGTSVAVAGDTAIVGAFFDNTAAGTDAGSAYVYTRSGGAWTQTQQLFASDTAAGDYFGAGAAMSGGTIVIGAYADDTPTGLGVGSAYLFSAGLGGSADLDNDGDRDLDDATILVSVLTGSNLDPLFSARADIDCSGASDGNDIQPFVNSLLAP